MIRNMAMCLAWKVIMAIVAMFGHTRGISAGEHWIWRKLTDNASQGTTSPANRASAATWSDAEGNLWLFGGVGGSIASPVLYNDLWKFDPMHKEFTLVKPGIARNHSMPVPRKDTSMCGVHSLLLVVFGGEDSSGHLLKDTWVFNIQSLEWIPLFDTDQSLSGHEKSSHIAARSSLASWCMPEAMVVFGGLAPGNILLDDMWEFSLRNLSWKKLEHAPAKAELASPAAQSHSLTWTIGDDLFLFRSCLKGRLMNIIGSTADRDCDEGDNLWKYNYRSRHWTTISGKETPVSARHCASSLTGTGGRLWLLSGQTDDVMIFTPKTQMWLHVNTTNSTEHHVNEAVPHSRCCQMSWGFNNVTYLYGGYSEDSKTLSDLWMLVPLKHGPFMALPHSDRSDSEAHYTPMIIFVITMSATFSVACAFSMMFCLKRMLESPPSPSFASNVRYTPVAIEEEGIDFG